MREWRQLLPSIRRFSMRQVRGRFATVCSTAGVPLILRSGVLPISESGGGVFQYPTDGLRSLIGPVGRVLPYKRIFGEGMPLPGASCNARLDDPMISSTLK